jgi:hypothetical protein
MSTGAGGSTGTQPVARWGGIDGNERLTAGVAVALILLLAVEGVTIVFLGQLLPVHLFVGALLIGPVLLKLASTGYRFVRYYTRAPAYVDRGPPHIVLRAIGPIVVASTVAVLATGIALLALGPQHRDPLLLLHKASFIVWIAFTGVHVLGHLRGLGAAREDLIAAGHELPGRSARAGTLAFALVGGVVLAIALVPLFGAWLHAR